MENYKLVNQWAASLTADKAFKEILDFKAKYSWVKLLESTSFIGHMHEDLPKILNIIRLQEKQHAVLRMENEKLRKYIEVNGLADECILNSLKEKFGIDI